jgi:16S rRNA (cytosine1402-N4)-methyltransferase
MREGGQAPITEPFHRPVLAGTVCAWAEGSRRAVDATAGGGGHAEILRAAGAELLLIDRDPAALAAARARLGEGPHYLQAAFASPEALAAVRSFHPDRILLDLGVSSHQLDSAERGFTFGAHAPLDMRMTPGAGPSAADLLNTWPEDALAHALRSYADEPRARRLARTIVRRRLRAPFVVSDDFVNAIREVLGPRAGPGDFARLFQALRIATNDELGQLERALPVLREALVTGGRIAAITYHSGEDRIVKNAFRDWSRACICPPRQPVCTCRGHPLGRLLTRKAVRPEAPEVRANPRARSAGFRSFESTERAAADRGAGTNDGP